MISYDPRTNLPATVTDPRGAVTTYTRNAAGLPKTIARPEGATTAMEYNDFGQVTKVTNPNGHVTSYAYFGSGEGEGYLQPGDRRPGRPRPDDPLRGRPPRQRHRPHRPARHAATTHHNELDWTVEETAAAGALDYTTTYSFDKAGQVTQVREPYGLGAETFATHITYGSVGEVLSVARETGRAASATTTYSYDANRNPTRVDRSRTATRRSSPTTRATSSRDGRWGRTRPRRSPRASPTMPRAGDGATTDGRANEWTREHDGYGRRGRHGGSPRQPRRTAYDDGGNATETRSLGAGGSLSRRAAPRTTSWDAPYDATISGPTDPGGRRADDDRLRPGRQAWSRPRRPRPPLGLRLRQRRASGRAGSDGQRGRATSSTPPGSRRRSPWPR